MHFHVPYCHIYLWRKAMWLCLNTSHFSIFPNKKSEKATVKISIYSSSESTSKVYYWEYWECIERLCEWSVIPLGHIQFIFIERKTRSKEDSPALSFLSDPPCHSFINFRSFFSAADFLFLSNACKRAFLYRSSFGKMVNIRTVYVAFFVLTTTRAVTTSFNSLFSDQRV